MLVVDDDDDVLLEQEIEAAQPEGDQQLPDAPTDEPDVAVDVETVSAADFSLLPLAEDLALAHKQRNGALADEKFLTLRRAIRHALRGARGWR